MLLFAYPEKGDAMAYTEEQLIEAFNMMWGKYPEPVRLIDKNEIIIAGNEAYLATSGPEMIGTCCRDLQPAELHIGCRHAKCIKTGEAQMKDVEHFGVTWHTYWVPVAGAPDYLVHFSNGIMETYAKMAAMQAEQAAAASE